MKELGIDPKDYKYASSDDKSTTLLHKKGHTLRIAHDVLSPKNKAILIALGKANQPNDQEPQKMAEGGMPCVNPNCKSHGQSHPNCKCYGGAMAEGGKVKHFCSQNRRHDDTCEYAKCGPVKQDKPGNMTASEQCFQDGGQAIDQSNIDPTTGEQDTSPRAVKNQDTAQKAQQAAQQPGSLSDVWENVKSGLMNAEGGRVCKACGGSVNRKMYADSNDAVSQDDSVPEALRPNSNQDDSQLNMNVDSNNAPTGGESEKKSKWDHFMEWAQRNEDKKLSTPDQQPMPQQPASQSLQQIPLQDTDQGQDQSQQTPAPQEQNPLEQQLSNENNYLDQGGMKQLPYVQVNPKDYAALSAKDMGNEVGNFAQDINNGHISPKTLGDLLWKDDDGKDKGTLGKIGTIFGMLLSGAGSGLAHQPNMLMEMMKKQMDNDLEAQKQSKLNAVNYLRLNQQNEFNKAAIKINAQNANNMTLEQNIKAVAQTQAMHNWAGLNKMMQIGTSYPPGSPERQKFDSMMPYLFQQVMQSNGDIFAKAGVAASMSRFGQNPQGQGGSPQDNESSYQNQQKALRRSGNEKMADDNDAHHIPYVPGAFTKAPTEQDRAVVEGHQKLNAGLDYLRNNIDRLASMNHYSAAYTQGLEEVRKTQADLREGVLGTVYRESEQPLLDQLLKMPANKLMSYQTKAQIDQLKTINNRDYGTKMKNLGWVPPQGQQSQSQQPQSQNQAPKAFQDYVKTNLSNKDPQVQQRVQFIKSKYGI